jgi:hypothetical protein
MGEVRTHIRARGKRARLELQRLLAAFAYPFSDVRRARPGRAVAAVKEALAVRGLASAYCRPPELQLRAGERTRVHELVAKLDDLREA